MHQDFFNKPVSSASLAVYRILFGLLMAFGMARFWYQGWIERAFLEPQVLLKYWGFEWVQLWPGNGIYWHFAGLFVVCLLLSAGFKTRWMSVLFFFGFTYIELLDASNYLNHYYLISLLGFINMFLPLNARWSLDTYWGWAEQREFIPAWCLNWLRLQIGTVYFFAGVAKFGGDWLLQAQPLNIWLTSSRELPLVGGLLDKVWVHYLMSWTGFLFDISIPFWMLWRKTRSYGYAAIVVFHLFTWILFPIGMFPFIMIFSGLIFFEADWPLKLRSRLPTEAGASPPKWVKTPWPAVMLTGWFLIQWTMPLRHLLYPGNVLWSEEGMRFSWKVMIREKNAETVFKVIDRKSGRQWYVSPSEYLLRHQEAEMSGTPDLILQFAHYLRRRLHQDQGLDVSVYVENLTSFNGRPAQPLVDPRVDLTLWSDGLGPKPWILPEPKGPVLMLSSKGEKR